MKIVAVALLILITRSDPCRWTWAKRVRVVHFEAGRDCLDNALVRIPGPINEKERSEDMGTKGLVVYGDRHLLKREDREAPGFASGNDYPSVASIKTYSQFHAILLARPGVQEEES